MKHVTVQADIEDIGGFYMDLMKSGYEVLGISRHEGSVVVRLDDLEEKDPAVISESWAGRPAVAPTRKELLERKRLQEEFEQGRPERLRLLREAKTLSSDDGFIPDFGTEQILPLEESKDQTPPWGKLKNILKSLW